MQQDKSRLSDIKDFVTESASFKKYFFNTGWFFVEKILRIAFSFGVSILLARHFGPEGFGVLSFAISYAALGIPISNLGLDSILVKEFVNKDISEEEILGTSIVLRLIGTLIVNFSLFFIYKSFLSSNGSNWEILVVSILLIANFFQISNVIEFYFQASVKYKFATISLSVSMFVANIFRIVIVYLNEGLVWISATYLVEFLTLALTLILLFPRVGKHLGRWKYNPIFAKKVLTEAWPLVLSSIMVTIYMKIDQVMIKEIMDSREVGFYSTGIKFSEFFYFLPVAISRSLNPLLAKNFNQDERFYEHRLMVIMGITFWCFLVLAIFFHFFSQEIITILFGLQYLPSHEVLKIHGYAGMITGMSCFLSQRFILKRRGDQHFWGTLSGAICNLVLNFILIPQIGGIGAAYATLISYHIPSLTIGIFWDKSVPTLLFRSISYPFILAMNRK